jgi:predicted DNA-binding transcriptional regulator AlpA
MNEKDFIPPQLNLDVTYPKDIETCPNTFHGIGPKGNILLKIDGAKRVGRGILLAQNSDGSEDILKCRSKLVHITPEAYPLEDAQSAECFDAKTGEKYCFIGVYVQKSAGQHPAESIKSSSATALDTTHLLEPPPTPEESTANKKIASPPKGNQQRHKKRTSDELERVHVARQSGCNIRIKRPTVEALTGLSRATIYRYLNETKFPAPIQKAGNERDAFWLLSDIDRYLGLETKFEGGK